MTISKDASAPLVVVCGATGNQGGSVIKSFAESDKPYRIRALTRDTSKPAAQKLAQQGAELFAVSLAVENKEQVYKAFEGATYAFAVTNFWDHLNKDKEVADGKVLIDAAHNANVKRLVWSGLADCTKVSGGKYAHVYHFDSKANVTEYARQKGVLFVNVQPACYMDNFKGLSPPIKQADGTYAIFGPQSPDDHVALIDTESDYGLFVRHAFESTDVKDGSDVCAFGDSVPMGKLTQQLSEISGKQIKYVQMARDDFIAVAISKGAPESVAKEMTEMWQFIGEFGYFGKRDSEVEDYRGKLTRKPHTWVDFCKETDWNKLLD